MELIPYGGWNRCLRLISGSLEAILTLEVGPRIIRYGFVDGPNELVEYAKDMGKTGGDTYRSYGGHRLWIAPEEDPKTMHPDNAPVEYREDNGWTVLTAPAEQWFIQKELRVRFDGDALCLEHRIYNRGVYAIDLAPWALTVMSPGGTCLFPQPDFIPHAEKVLPARPLVMWNYTDLSDPRWTIGKRIGRLRQDANLGAQKLGAFVEQGWAGYANHGNLFLKRFDAEPDYEYPDFGCNFETFTREDMLEVESLGPMETIPPGGYASHWETWYLYKGIEIPVGDQACDELLSGLVTRSPFLATNG